MKCSSTTPEKKEHKIEEDGSLTFQYSVLRTKVSNLNPFTSPSFPKPCELVLRYGGQDKVPHLLPQPNPEKMNSVHYAVFKGRPLHYKCQGYGVFELSILARARCDGVPGASFVRCDNAFAAYEVYYRARDEGVVVNL
ncbi:hypothetical protein K435DRAFT_798512 [Dendrothele bispora CBS 962.96]|uniref:Uncharacterized protein n=1 Tax=Dendrothele bispora (strain CBS 962.96) TaxID=1314807 RepID=A0A4S8LZ09_DENBC|nr:hypothetical protein K435DRAFT_798512 [Dendrothele bispora CBS 962.96]